jgi:hypothetical protein
MADDNEKSQAAPTPLKQRAHRPAEGQVTTSASDMDRIVAKKVQKSRDRLTAHEWNVRCLRLAGQFPSSTTLNSRQALERVPEFRYAQNAYGFLKTAAKRKLAEDLGDGIFQFLPSATERLQKLVDEVSVQVKSMRAPDAPPATVEQTASGSLASPVHSPSPAPVEPSKRTDAEEIVRIVRHTGRPHGHRPRHRGKDDIDTLLKLSQRYRSNQQFKIDDLIIPLPECRDSVYGNADIGTGEPPVCVVIQTYEPELNATNPDEIKVLFLDAKGQAHVASAASWRFMPYRRG